ncbi:MAG: exocyst complex component exo84 [Alectoria fallacina]|uniref:Exocyst complex component EXO84 n=1 Tax=Alectoria fallacina TaxID=1903189 RepID=A0A8H3PGS2_9LECA|nr:MAG: exocyst complex component exo84 [Alectoria fallacina]
MEDKGKGFSLRQKKSRQVVPKQISGPIPTISQAASRGPTRPNVNGKVDTSTANTSDIVKRRYSTRFTNLPDFSNADAPPVPSIPILPAQFAQSDSRPSTARQNQQLPLDANALKDPNLQVESYSTSLLSDASDQELRDYQASLRKLKNRTSTDLQQNVYQNRTQFIKISKEAEKLKGEMRTLRGLMSELTNSLNQASMNAGAPEPRPTLDDGTRSRARKQANRSSVANLEAMWNTQLHALWKNVEGSQKFLPAIPGRHVVLEQSTWLELDAATWKAKRYAHIFLLNDHLMVATKRKRRIDPNAMTNSDAGPMSSSRTVADKCWPLQDIDVVDLASTGSSGISDRGGMSKAISIRYGHESFTYRSDKSSVTEKTNLLQAFRRTADELRRALQADMEENFNRSKETMDYLTTGDTTLSNKTDLLRSLSGAKDRPEILIDVDGKHQNLRWVESQIDELDSEVALQKFEDAVRHVEKLRRLAKGLKGNMIAQGLISTKVDERARKLADILALRLTTTHAQLTATQANIAYLVRLNFTPLARTTYLAARTTLIHTRARSLMFQGDLPQHINQLSFVYFALIRNTVKTYQQCFPPVMMSSCIQWAKERLDELNALLGRQLGSVSPSCVDWNSCLGKAIENAGMLGEVGLDFANLVGLGLMEGRKDGEQVERRTEGE